MATPTSPETLLREAGLRATPGRIALIRLLEKESSPLTVAAIEKRIGSALNSVTLYRALEALASAGIVTRVNFEHDHAHYELAAGRPHHHHIVCKHCGHVRDIDLKHADFSLEQVPGFARVERYSLELFGVCTTCVHK